MGTQMGTHRNGDTQRKGHIKMGVMVLLVTSTHIIQITLNVTSIANFNLVLDIDIESTEHNML